MGLVTSRVGGLPMRITYFLTPSEMLLLQQQMTASNRSGESLAQLLANNSCDSEGSLGLSVTLALEACQSPNLLPASNLLNRSNLARIPLGPANSIQLCARFAVYNSSLISSNSFLKKS